MRTVLLLLLFTPSAVLAEGGLAGIDTLGLELSTGGPIPYPPGYDRSVDSARADSVRLQNRAIGLSILADAERQLLKAGIAPTPHGPRPGSHFPVLQIEATARREQIGTYFYVEVKLQQDVYTRRGEPLKATTWHRHRIGIVTEDEIPKEVLDAAKHLLGRFVKDYLRAN